MRILFWDHYDATMGGIEKLIITLTADLSETHEIVVIAKESGTIVESLRGIGARFTRVDPEARRLAELVAHDDLLIDFGAFRELKVLSRANPRFLLWRVFPDIGHKSLAGLALFRQTFARLERRDSLVFMDDECHETACRELRKSFRKRILPLPIIMREKQYVVDRPRECINFTYVGRGSRIWKVHPVKKLVIDLGQITRERFSVHVFTDTDELYRQELAGLVPSNVEVAYHFGYTMEALSQKLLELSDLHYSMGTACLEGAILGIPTIIADASRDDFPADYRYRWLVEDIQNYAGGWVENATRGSHRLEEIIATARDPSALRRISDTTYAETVANFSSKEIAQRILDLHPRARVRDVLRYMPSYWLSKGKSMVRRDG
jgi:hypothetical protein